MTSPVFFPVLYCSLDLLFILYLSYCSHDSEIDDSHLTSLFVLFCFSLYNYQYITVSSSSSSLLIIIVTYSVSAVECPSPPISQVSAPLRSFIKRVRAGAD